MRLNFSKAFVDGRTIEDKDEKITFKNHRIGDLIVTSGFIKACDPFVFFDAVPFTIPVCKGRFPVILSVATFHSDNDQRVAYAMLKISDEPTVKWELALFPDQDPTTLEEGEIFGYPVDAGTGCFMDKESAELLLSKSEDGTYADFMIAEMEKNYIATWDWASIELDHETGANVIAFKSGLGDGVYASYFGYDANGKVTSLITDFAVIDDNEIYSVD